MINKIKLSIIIVNFNTYQFLDKCLRSISLNNIDRLSFEVIVIDNASKDNSPALIKKNYPKIILISNKKNTGFAKANNQAVCKAKGEYILFLNPDTIITSNTLSFMTDFMDKNQKAGIATCKVELADGTLDDACHRGLPTPWNAFCHFVGIAKLFPSSRLLNGYHLGFYEINKTHEIDACAGAFMLVRKVVGEQVKWMDEEYFWYGEDLDFCYRVKKASWKIIFVPDVKILHYKGVSGGIKSHSQDLTTANRETKLLATKARFEVMRIFYEKHYKGKYPKWLTWLIMRAIKIKEYINLQKY